MLIEDTNDRVMMGGGGLMFKVFSSLNRYKKK